MTSWGCRCILAWVLAGDLLLVQRAAQQLLQPPATATTATNQRQRVQLFVAGEDFHAQSVSSGTQEEAGPNGGLAQAVARGRELLQKGSLHEAAEVLQVVLASKDDEPSTLLHLAEVAAQLGQPRRAVVLTNRLLGLEQLTPEVRSFMLNRRGLYLQDANDLTGAQESYELAMEIGWQGQSINRLALRNLAALLHYQVFPSETAVGPSFSALERAIELYRVALGRDRTALQTALRSKPSGPEIRNQDSGIGGPIARYSVFRELAAALLLAGRPREAVSELEHAVTELSSEDGNQLAAKPTADKEEAAATTRRIDTALLWDSLSGARRVAGDVPGALAAGQWIYLQYFSHR